MSAPMDREAALQEARRRWGPYSAVSGPTCNLADQPEYMVTEIVPGEPGGYDNHHDTHWGIGVGSWEAAFADADARAAGKGDKT